MKRIILIAALTGLTAGAGWAAIPNVNGQIDACYGRAGALRVIDTAIGQKCTRLEHALTWNQRGPTGPPGPPGPPGSGSGAPDAYVFQDGGIGLPAQKYSPAVSGLVAAGRYTVNATVTVEAVSPDPGRELVYCALQADGKTVYSTLVTVQAGMYMPVTVAGSADLAAPGTLAVQCAPDNPALTTYGATSVLTATRAS